MNRAVAVIDPPSRNGHMEIGDVTSLADAINHEHELCRASFINSLEHAMECGRLLAEAKAQCVHGEWLGWIEANTEVSEQTARGYMQLHRNRKQILSLCSNRQRAGDLSISSALALLADSNAEIKKRDKASAQEAAKQSASEPKLLEWAGEIVPNSVMVADIYDLNLPAGSVDMIFTDPPYHDEHLHLFDRLGEMGAQCLKPGAYLMTYCGKMFLPDVLNSLIRHLEYVWTFCVFQSDGNQRIRKHHLYETWRPIVAFKKPGITPVMDWQPDAIKGTRDKEFHEWQQQIEPARKWIATYTRAGDLVLDPFSGGGTTAFACIQGGRRFLAFDKDKRAVLSTLERLSK